MNNYEKEYHDLKKKVEQLIIAFEAGKEYQLDPQKFDQMMYELRNYVLGG